VCDCPFCGRVCKFGYNVNTNRGNCFVCGNTVYGLRYFLGLYEPGTLKPAKWVYRETNYTHIDTKEGVPAWFHHKSRLWCRLKGITMEASLAANLLYYEDKGELTTPVTSIDKDLVPTVVRRQVGQRESKWLWGNDNLRGVQTLYGWNLEAVRGRESVLVCEGISDLLYTGLYDVGIAVMGSRLKPTWYYWLKKNFKRVVFWFDPDEAGQKAAKASLEACQYRSISAMIVESALPPKDYRPGSVQIEAVRSLLV